MAQTRLGLIRSPKSNPVLVSYLAVDVPDDDVLEGVNVGEPEPAWYRSGLSSILRMWLAFDGELGAVVWALIEEGDAHRS